MADNKQINQELVKTLAAVVMFAGVCAFLYYKYIWAPYSLRAQKAEEEIKVVSAEIAKATAVAKRMDQLNKEIEELRKNEKDAEEQLPKVAKVPDLIYMLVDISRKYKVSIGSITPQDRADKQYYTEINYQMVVSGSYHSIGKFIAAIATAPRIFTVKNLNITGAGDKAAATFTLVAYQYRG